MKKESYLLLSIGDVKIGGQFYFFQSLILVSNSSFSYRKWRDKSRKKDYVYYGFYLELPRSIYDVHY